MTQLFFIKKKYKIIKYNKGIRLKVFILRNLIIFY